MPHLQLIKVFKNGTIILVAMQTQQYGCTFQKKHHILEPIVVYRERPISLYILLLIIWLCLKEMFLIVLNKFYGIFYFNYRVFSILFTFILYVQINEQWKVLCLFSVHSICNRSCLIIP